MRTFKPFLLFAFLLAACSPAFSQTPPDCTFTFTAPGPVTGSPVSNLYTNVSSNPIKTACTAWTYKYSADNASAVSIQLEGAADALTGSTHAPSGSYSALTASTATGSGTNPSTVATNAGVVLCCDFYPWVRINIITLTPVSGTAHISGTVYGYKTNSALNGGGGGGGGGITCLSGDVTAGTGSPCTNSTVTGVNGAAVPKSQTSLATNSAGQIIAGAASTGSFVLVEEHTASSSAELDFTASITSAYDTYVVEFVQVSPANNAVDIILQYSTNGGSTYDTTSGHYEWLNFRWYSSGNTQSGNGADSKIMISDGNNQVTNSASDGGLSGRMEIYNPLSGAAATRHAGQNTYKVNGGGGLGVTCAGDYTQTTAVNAFRILASSGNLASGTVRVYGLAH